MPAYCENPEKMFPIISSSMLPKGTFKGKVALVTGGGTGLGKAIATVLSTLGANVVIAARRLEVLQKTATEIETKTGGQVDSRVLPMRLDIRDPAQVKCVVDEIESCLGLPNIVVNNAAGNFIAATERLSPNAFKTITDIVLNGTFFVTQEVGKRAIIAKKPCNFLSITTTYAASGSPFVVPSACAKGGVNILTKSLAAEWGKFGIRLNCIAPGPIYTEGAFNRLDPSGMFAEEAHKNLPVGRLGHPDELANLSAYLVSDYSSWMTGAIVDFDGGEMVLKTEFAGLHAIANEQWAEVESMIRDKTGKKPKL